MIIVSKTTLATLRLFKDLISGRRKLFSNWGGHRATRPAVYAEPLSYADVQAVVRDAARFPTPVNPVGSMLSVSSTFVNDGGTLICLQASSTRFSALRRDARGRTVVRVQAGLPAEEAQYVAAGARPRDSFPGRDRRGVASAPCRVGDTKESSLNAPGYFSAHVVELTYVDDRGDLRVISDHADGDAFYEFKCSFGLMGVVVECLVETRPATFLPKRHLDGRLRDA